MKRKKTIYFTTTSILLSLFLNISCQPDSEEFAAPPEVIGNIYEQLEHQGNFTYYLSALDKSVYVDRVKHGNAWTIFASNDEAFEKFMKEEGYTSVNEIPDSRITDIVEYSIIEGLWNKTTLSYSTGSGYYEGSAFKRKTFYRDTIEIKGSDYPNTPDIDLTKTYNVVATGNIPKHTSYFLESYIDHPERAVENEDIEFMFDDPYNKGDMQVFDANVDKVIISAENGLIYNLDKVIEPQKNMYLNLTNPEYDGRYSLFKSLLDRFAFFSEKTTYYGENPPQTPLHELHFYNILYGGESTIPFNPYQEGYFIPLADAYLFENFAPGLIVPTNQALEDYINGDSMLAQTYDSYEEMPLNVLSTFLSPYFFWLYWSLCPSHQGNSINIDRDIVDYNLDDVVDKKYCSNGFFVGVDKVYENKKHSTVLGKALIDSNYSIMLKAINFLGYDDELTDNNTRFSVFGITNEQFKQSTFNDPNYADRKIQVVDYNNDLSVIQIQVTGDSNESNNRLYPESLIYPNSSDIFYVENTLKAIVQNQIIDSDIDFYADNFYETKSGDFIYANDGTIASAGNIQQNKSVSIIESKEFSNGVFYETDTHFETPLNYAYITLLENHDTFSIFTQALETSKVVDTINYPNGKYMSITSPAEKYTLLAPNNTAMQKAIEDGVIVDPGNFPEDATAAATAKKELVNFIKSHFIQASIPTDGITSGQFKTLYFEEYLDNEPQYTALSITNSNNGIQKSLSINSTNGESTIETGNKVNLFTKGIIIHETNNYIQHP